MKFPHTLRARLVLSHLLVSLLSILLIAAFAANSMIEGSRDELKRSLESLAYATGSGLEAPMERFAAGEVDAALVQSRTDRLLSSRPGLSYSIYTANGEPLAAGGGAALGLPGEAVPPEVSAALASSMGQGENIRPNADGVETLYIAARIQSQEGVLGAISLGAPMQSAMDAAARPLGWLALISALVALEAIIFGYWLANNLSNPIQSITETAERLAQGDLKARAEPSGTRELHRLAEVFNTMAGRLQAHVDELRAFVANASHELRTPLTVVKLRAEALRNGAMEDPHVAGQFLEEIEIEVDRLGKMVNDLLDLSRMEAGMVPGRRTVLHLEQLAAEVCETFNIRAARAEVALELHAAADLPTVKGNEDQLRRVLYNLVDNGIKFTPKGGRVDVYLAAGGLNRTVLLKVIDTGVGIGSEHMPHIFERFYRSDATRPRYGSPRGSGLGLAICKTIVENHGGKMGVTSQLGKGATFWAELPANTGEPARVEPGALHKEGKSGPLR